MESVVELESYRFLSLPFIGEQVMSTQESVTMEDFFKLIRGKSLVAASNPVEYIKGLAILREKEIAETHTNQLNETS
jgi:hypothetical protein